MHVFTRSCFVLIIITLPLSAIANPCDVGGIGGTGVKSNRGIDGTAIADEFGGVGGTGISSVQESIDHSGMQNHSGVGGTGILGVNTDFGTICVDNLEMHYWTSPASADVLLLPQTQSRDLIDSNQ